jgi:hypothetical protein
MKGALRHSKRLNAKPGREASSFLVGGIEKVYISK